MDHTPGSNRPVSGRLRRRGSSNGSFPARPASSAIPPGGSKPVAPASSGAVGHILGLCGNVSVGLEQDTLVAKIEKFRHLGNQRRVEPGQSLAALRATGFQLKVSCLGLVADELEQRRTAERLGPHPFNRLVDTGLIGIIGKGQQQEQLPCGGVAAELSEPS